MKVIIGSLLAVAVIVGGIILFATTGSEYEVIVDDSVSALEAELASINARVASGSLTAEAAVVARANIISRLDTINAQMQATSKAELTDAQRQQLNSALKRLKQVLITYQDTLNTVDAIAATDRRVSGGSRSLSSHFVGTLSTSEAAVVAADIKLETDGNIETAIDDIAEDSPETVAEVSEETTLPENFDSDDTAETATTSDEVAEDDAEDEETADEVDLNDAENDLEVSAETETEVEAQ